MILTIEQIQQTVQDYFKDKPVKKVYLFGSYAKGNPTEDSDVDLLVDLDYEKKIGLSYFGWSVYLGRILKARVDIASFNEINDRVLNNISPEMKVIYGAT